MAIRVTGPAGAGFTGNYGGLDSQRSVQSTVPATYNVKVDEGMFANPVSVTAVMQKEDPGTWPLTVEIINDGETVKKAITTAEYGVVTVNYAK